MYKKTNYEGVTIVGEKLSQRFADYIASIADNIPKSKISKMH